MRCVGDGASRGENRGGGVGRGRSGPEPGGGGGRIAAVQGFEEALDKDNAISLTVLCQLVMVFFLTTSMVLAGFLCFWFSRFLSLAEQMQAVVETRRTRMGLFWKKLKKKKKKKQKMAAPHCLCTGMKP